MRALAIAVLVGAPACAEPSSTSVSTPAFEVDGTEVERCDYEPIAAVGMLAPHVIDDQLELVLEWGGACEDHAFKLCWDATFEAASPLPVAHLSIVHEDNGDTCQTAWTSSHAFDLSPLADAWRDGPEHRLGPIQLRLDDGFGNTSSTVYDPAGDVVCDPSAQDCPAPDLSCLDLGLLVGSSRPVVACTQAPVYAGPGDPCAHQGQPLCGSGFVCHRDPKEDDCSHWTDYNELAPDAGCCVPACRLGPDASCPEAGQQCVSFSADGASPDAGMCAYGG